MVLLIMKKTILAIVAMMALSVARPRHRIKSRELSAQTLSAVTTGVVRRLATEPFSLLWALLGKAFR